MAEEGRVSEPTDHPPITVQLDPTSNSKDEASFNLNDELKFLIEDETYKQFERHFLMQGKGRRPDLPYVNDMSNKLLLQLFFLKEKSQASYRELTSWVHKVVPASEAVSEGKLRHRICHILEACKNMAPGELPALLKEMYNFDTIPQPLVDLGINFENLFNFDLYDKSPQDDVSNHVVVTLSQLLTKGNKTASFLRQWLTKLSVACASLSDKKLRLSVDNTLKIYKKLLKNKKSKELEEFFKAKFILTDTSVLQSSACKSCPDKDKLLSQKDEKIKSLQSDLYVLKCTSEKIKSELVLKDEALKEIQENKMELLSELKQLRKLADEYSKQAKEIKKLETEIKEISDSKLYYRRNKELSIANKELESRIHNLEKQLIKVQATNLEKSKKLKLEQDMKNKYKRKADALNDENSSLVSVLNTDIEQEELPLKQVEGKCTMYSDNVRQLYMALQGEANVAAVQASKVVMLVAKYLFKKKLSWKDLPCPRTCLNFMDEANHIAKQHIVDQIQDSSHFTYATDGTSREKRHFIEHHIVLDNGSTLSVGFTEVADDTANTLLEKSLDLFDEISDIYSQSQTVECNSYELFKNIISKMKALMSDRAANMKLFNKKMLDYKQDLLGGDAIVHFLYCNAHFLIGLAEETEKAVRTHETEVEGDLGRKLGRDAQPLFKTWNSDETSAFRLLRTAADVFGPRGDEKNGCREEWLAHCEMSSKKSKFTSYRSNRFNNIFENAIALLFHYNEALHFLKDYVSHSNKKLQSILFDLQDQKIMSFITAIGLFSVYVTTPYWALMNSKTPYGRFAVFVQDMKKALEKWSSDLFQIEDLPCENPIFGINFKLDLDIADPFLKSELCDQSLAAAAFKNICNNSKRVLDRQLSDFLPGGVYGSSLSTDIQDLLDTCPLTNLTGERLFGDLDYDMSKRRTASTYLRSTVSMWKHNKPSDYLNHKSPSDLKRTMAAGRKYGKELKEKHKAAVQTVKEKVKNKIIENERKKREKEIQDKEKQANILDDILSQGGICKTKEDLDNLLSQPKVLQNLKTQIRFRKYYMGAKDLRLTGNFRILYNSLCSHLGFENDTQDTTSELTYKRKKTEGQSDDETCNEMPDSDSDEWHEEMDGLDENDDGNEVAGQ